MLSWWYSSALTMARQLSIFAADGSGLVYELRAQALLLVLLLYLLYCFLSRFLCLLCKLQLELVKEHLHIGTVADHAAGQPVILLCRVEVQGLQVGQKRGELFIGGRAIEPADGICDRAELLKGVVRAG